MTTDQDSVRALQPEYRSGKSPLGSTFFAPCLRVCSGYRRAVGYFSSAVLRDWAAALPRLARGNDIHVKLLASPNISAEDKVALQQAVDDESRGRLRSQLVADIIEKALKLNEADAADTEREILTWLVANDRLEIRFAFPSHVDSAGDFHVKIGVFEFPWGDKIAFSGSANETQSGYSRNYESIDVERSRLRRQLAVCDPRRTVGAGCAGHRPCLRLSTGEGGHWGDAGTMWPSRPSSHLELRE